MDYSETPAAFFWRRLHSFTGLVLIAFIIFHLLTNSQAALFIGDDAAGFIRDANWIHDLPYLPVIEFVVILLPFVIHSLWGLKYLWTGKSNSLPTDGSKPQLQGYARNQFYTWQRLTSWILLIGVIGHVGQMRFADYPAAAQIENHKYYVTNVSFDEGLYTLAARLNFSLLTKEQVLHQQKSIEQLNLYANPSTPVELLANQWIEQKKLWLKALESKPIGPGEIVALTPNFGTAELLMVRDTFKSPIMMGLYTGFVIAAVFHAFNGLWTFLITWGLLLSDRSQLYMKWISVALMFILGAMSLSAIWLTYWVNLRH